MSAAGDANGPAMIDVRSVLAVAGGAALGGVVRFILTTLVAARVGADYAYLATFGINVTGSFLIGVAMEIARARGDGGALWRVFVVVGILGGYTTFSSFSYEALRLVSSALTAVAIAYVVASVRARRLRDLCRHRGRAPHRRALTVTKERVRAQRRPAS